MKNSQEEKILGISIDKVTFKSHFKNLFKKASKKIKALVSLSRFLNDAQKCLIFKSIIRSQFSYSLIVWLFCSRLINNNKSQERALRIVSNGQTSNFETLLAESNDSCDNHRNISTIMIEAYQMQNKLVPPVIKLCLKEKPFHII